MLNAVSQNKRRRSVKGLRHHIKCRQHFSPTRKFHKQIVIVLRLNTEFISAREHGSGSLFKKDEKYK